MPRQHPREKIVATAESELSIAVSDLIEGHGLTYGELHRVINSVQSNWIKYQIRDERHPNDPNKPGGVE